MSKCRHPPERTVTGRGRMLIKNRKPGGVRRSDHGWRAGKLPYRDSDVLVFQDARFNKAVRRRWSLLHVGSANNLMTP